MRKILLSTSALFAFTFMAHAQESGFTAGVHTGLPIGDFKFGYSVNVGVDVAYLWSDGNGFSSGIATGYSHYIGKDVDNPYGFDSYRFEDGAFVPLAATARVAITDFLFAGVDLGYAKYVRAGGGGGFYFQPKAGYSMEKIDVFVSYKGIVSNGTTLTTIGLGAAYKF